MDMFDDMTLWIVVGGLAVAAIVVVVLVLRARAPKEEQAFHFRCPNCKRKLRYFARQAGHKGMCNSCKGTITFPLAVALGRR
jgi:hypothetical protein